MSLQLKNTKNIREQRNLYGIDCKNNINPLVNKNNIDNIYGVVVDVIDGGRYRDSIIIADEMDSPVDQQIRVFCSKDYSVGDKVLVRGAFRFGSPRTELTKYEMYHYEFWRVTPDIEISLEQELISKILLIEKRKLSMMSFTI